MATKSQAKRDGTVQLTVSVELQDGTGEDNPHVAYVFSAGGTLIDRQPVEDGQAVLSVSNLSSARSVRVVVGPHVDEDGALGELLRRGAVERFERLERGAAGHRTDFVIPSAAWWCWFLSRCAVRGTLVRRVQSSGLPVDLPVCNATVEIYEVDPLAVLIPKLPDDLLERLRDLLRIPVLPIPPEPDPDPIVLPVGPGPDPGPELRKGLLPRAGAAGASEPVMVPDELHAAAILSSDLGFRDALVAHPLITRPLLCWLFPRFVTRQLVATAITDDCGRFAATFSKGCHNADTPDLYFVARQRVFPYLAPVTIYEPTPIACNTWWDYQCGSDVTLVTTHKLARTCSPCPPVIAGERWVIVMAIGNLLLSDIHGTSVALAAATNAATIGLTAGGAPFGGLLRPRIEFDPALRDELGVRYYRVSVRRHGDPNPPIPLDGTITRHYAHVVNGDVVVDAYPLGPTTSNGQPALFEIPPSIPPQGVWSLPDVVEDTASAKWQTPEPTAIDDMAGVYEIHIDLFDASGTPANLAATGIHFVVPTFTNATGTVFTEEAEAPTLELVQANTFVMLVHVDNNRCTAETSPPVLDGVPANPCGVLEYTPGTEAASNVRLDYVASHPHDFATRSFVVSRGGTPILTQGGDVAGGTFHLDSTVAALLGACPLGGFAETLYVAATATNGWSRQAQYDASAPPRGFALAPPQQ